MINICRNRYFDVIAKLSDDGLYFIDILTDKQLCYKGRLKECLFRRPKGLNHQTKIILV
ncbi:hypothetical protein NEIFL0001_1753 [Neisseria flavescens SK114]|nr:hypothetical protein NEIFL0001_1753 [Neisseria flavescens SK114]